MEIRRNERSGRRSWATWAAIGVAVAIAGVIAVVVLARRSLEYVGSALLSDVTRQSISADSVSGIVLRSDGGVVATLKTALHSTDTARGSTFALYAAVGEDSVSLAAAQQSGLVGVVRSSESATEDVRIELTRLSANAGRLIGSLLVSAGRDTTRVFRFELYSAPPGR